MARPKVPPTPQKSNLSKSKTPCPYSPIFKHDYPSSLLLVARPRRPLLDDHGAPPRARRVRPPSDARVARARRPAVAVVVMVAAVMVVVVMRPSHGDDLLVVVVFAGAVESEAHLEGLGSEARGVMGDEVLVSVEGSERQSRLDQTVAERENAVCVWKTRNSTHPRTHAFEGPSPLLYPFA
ncbi:hypothetical protein B0T11DRAFT_271594 [Plectosphaerella cucumerina]|uniref:Uncharacterized protein n=1 Tax=Plectosphaerella cucumerina TaxID=40658 RepID=A0A8K0X8R2_9PEZI|nr:hypothetical protein B0T11DRAFT_271594 [Plectosphaerella cucumerina]